MASARRQAKRIYFVEEFGQNIKNRPTKLDVLRSEFEKAGGDVRNFDDLLTVFEHRPYKRVFADPRNPVGRALRIVDSFIGLAQTSLSAIPNLPQTAMLVPKYVGVLNYFRAVASVLRHPLATASQLSALGAMNRSIMEWTLRPGHGPEDFARIVRGVVQRATGLQWISQFNNQVAGIGFTRLADAWRKNGLTAKDVSVAKDLRLLPDEVAAIRAGKMTEAIYNKIVQNGVKITQFITEDPHRMSKWQNIPVVNGLLAYNNYAIGTAKAVLRTAREVTDSLQSKDPARMAAAGYRLGLMLVGAVGAGTVSILLRRTAKGQQALRDDETSADLVGKALWEVSILGPTQRMADAFDYTGDSSQKVVTALSPKLKYATDVLDALRGTGRYGEYPLPERVGEALKKNTPIVRGGMNWYDHLKYPMVQQYSEVHALARAYQEKTGTKKTPTDAPINPHYVAVDEAIRREDDEALVRIVGEYKIWAKAQGWDGDKARNNLHSALEGRRPANFNKDEYKKFLASLPADKRSVVERVQASYNYKIDTLMLRPGEMPKLPRLETLPKLPKYGDWYND
jgi:hypothetical protein